ncbi:uncharacterized protein B0H18DRAFT_1126451 [Fomitopsis serialis]|uniref:uncharacterized protein n=1 Tax=Fomitopsis serialis TaxID=139415 RepID=UPI0020085820|nr:uncharacterized protein B0H18DRAFT_1126451 [Neoantrodia serialis]KAH9913249.1 hypothetical protein B0H18DRAFT_1126451 [Neoantrodia serialis]
MPVPASPSPLSVPTPAGILTHEASVVRPAGHEHGTPDFRDDLCVVPTTLHGNTADAQSCASDVPVSSTLPAPAGVQTSTKPVDSMSDVHCCTSDVPHPSTICCTMGTSSLPLDVHAVSENDDAPGVFANVPSALADSSCASGGTGVHSTLHDGGPRTHIMAATPASEGSMTNNEFVVCLPDVKDGVFCRAVSLYFDTTARGGYIELIADVSPVAFPQGMRDVRLPVLGAILPIPISTSPSLLPTPMCGTTSTELAAPGVGNSTEPLTPLTAWLTSPALSRHTTHDWHVFLTVLTTTC